MNNTYIRMLVMSLCFIGSDILCASKISKNSTQGQVGKAAAKAVVKKPTLQKKQSQKKGQAKPVVKSQVKGKQKTVISSVVQQPVIISSHLADRVLTSRDKKIIESLLAYPRIHAEFKKFPQKTWVMFLKIIEKYGSDSCKYVQQSYVKEYEFLKKKISTLKQNAQSMKKLHDQEKMLEVALTELDLALLEYAIEFEAVDCAWIEYANQIISGDFEKLHTALQNVQYDYLRVQDAYNTESLHTALKTAALEYALECEQVQNAWVSYAYDILFQKHETIKEVTALIVQAEQDQNIEKIQLATQMLQKNQQDSIALQNEKVFNKVESALLALPNQDSARSQVNMEEFGKQVHIFVNQYTDAHHHYNQLQDTLMNHIKTLLHTDRVSLEQAIQDSASQYHVQLNCLRANVHTIIKELAQLRELQKSLQETCLGLEKQSAQMPEHVRALQHALQEQVKMVNTSLIDHLNKECQRIDADMKQLVQSDAAVLRQQLQVLGQSFEQRMSERHVQQQAQIQRLAYYYQSKHEELVNLSQESTESLKKEIQNECRVLREAIEKNESLLVKLREHGQDDKQTFVRELNKVQVSMKEQLVLAQEALEKASREQAELQKKDIDRLYTQSQTAQEATESLRQQCISDRKALECSMNTQVSMIKTLQDVIENLSKEEKAYNQALKQELLQTIQDLFSSQRQSVERMLGDHTTGQKAHNEHMVQEFERLKKECAHVVESSMAGMHQQIQHTHQVVDTAIITLEDMLKGLDVQVRLMHTDFKGALQDGLSSVKKEMVLEFQDIKKSVSEQKSLIHGMQHAIQRLASDIKIDQQNVKIEFLESVQKHFGALQQMIHEGFAQQKSSMSSLQKDMEDARREREAHNALFEQFQKKTALELRALKVSVKQNHTVLQSCLRFGRQAVSSLRYVLPVLSSRKTYISAPVIGMGVSGLTSVPAFEAVPVQVRPQEMLASAATTCVSGAPKISASTVTSSLAAPAVSTIGRAAAPFAAGVAATIVAAKDSCVGKEPLRFVGLGPAADCAVSHAQFMSRRSVLKKIVTTPPPVVHPGTGMSALKKMGLVVAGCAALGYGGYKYYQSLQDKKNVVPDIIDPVPVVVPVKPVVVEQKPIVPTVIPKQIQKKKVQKKKVVRPKGKAKKIAVKKMPKKYTQQALLLKKKKKTAMRPAQRLMGVKKVTLKEAALIAHRTRRI